MVKKTKFKITETRMIDKLKKNVKNTRKEIDDKQ